MPYVYYGEAGGARIVRYGYGTTQLLSGGGYYSFEALVDTWEVSPAGIVGDVVFRGVDMLVRHNNGYGLTLTAYVNGLAKTQQWFTASPPPGGQLEGYAEIQAPIAARGSRLRVTLLASSAYGELEIVSIGCNGMPLRLVP